MITWCCHSSHTSHIVPSSTLTVSLPFHTSHIVLTTVPSVNLSFLLVHSDVNQVIIGIPDGIGTRTEAMDRAALAAAASGRRGVDGEPDDVLDLLRRLRLRVCGRGTGARGGRVRSVSCAYERLLTHVCTAPSAPSMERLAPHSPQHAHWMPVCLCAAGATSGTASRTSTRTFTTSWRGSAKWSPSTRRTCRFSCLAN